MKTKADVLEAAAKSIRIQEASDFDPVCKSSGFTVFINDCRFNDPPAAYEFPLAVFEGKAAFKNDELFFIGNDTLPSRKICLTSKNTECDHIYHAADGDMFRLEQLSWNQPKLKLTIKLDIDTVNHYANINTFGATGRNLDMINACRDALKSKS